MNDRLGEIGGGATPSWAQEADIVEAAEVNNEVDVELGYDTQDQTDDFETYPTNDENKVVVDPGKKIMELFFLDVEKLKADIDLVTQATKRIGEINEESIMSTSDIREKELSEEMRPLVNETNSRAKSTKNLLACLKDENIKYKKNDTIKNNDIRIRENLCNTLTRKFIDEMKRYQNVQQKYKTDIKNKATRQVQIVKPDATPEEIDMIMKSEGGRDGLFRETILAGGVADSVKQTYTNVAGRYQDVVALEQSVAELHQMFLDFALLTEQQGELLDLIEFNVKSAADYVEDANVEVYESIQYQKKIRKKQCWIIVIVVVVLFILLFSIGVLP